jgi:hypothetical protein
MRFKLGWRRDSAFLRSIAAALLTIHLLVSLSPVRADGGTVRLSEVAGNYRITVFTSPTPLRAGLIDVSVLVQDAKTSGFVPDARVTITMAPLERPGETVVQPASHEAATNKTFQAAVVELPSAGWWNFVVEIDGPSGRAETHLTIEAGEPWPGWVHFLPWILWPLIPIGLFAMHQWLVRRRKR